MKQREDKHAIVEELTQHINGSNHFYLADISELNAEDTSNLRRKCFEKEVKLMVVKNTLLKKALEQSEGEFDDLYSILKNSTSIMFSDTGNIPAKLIKEFRKKHDKPVLKGAFVEESIYIGDEQLENLASLKSKEELIGDIILLLQSPAINVISSLKSGGNTLAGVIKTLSEKE
ncbi:MAG TPA: 50S ribosomal protein L10 [Bacteroidales bacterium]|nr:50S ribosomal protein L10 [Bacteroidales bacterium]